MMQISFHGQCKNCGASFEITDNYEDKFSICKDKLMCPVCGSEFPAPSIERLASIAGKIHSCALFADPFLLESITVKSSPTDPEHLRAQQSENDFHQKRLKELEAVFGDHE